ERSQIDSSITPALQVGSRRRALQDALDDLRRVELVITQTRDRIRARVIAVPAMFRAWFVINFTAIIRRLQEIFDEIDSVVQVVVISFADVNVNLAPEFWSKPGPIAFHDVTEIEILAPVLGD